MEDLDDYMLTQILFRLPNCAAVIACSPVNKRWYSLISSDPNFSDQFVDHKKKTTAFLKGSGFDHEDDEPPLTFITTRHYRENPLITEFVFGSRKLLQKYMSGNIFIIEATFKDLVLTRQLDSRVYYITNPLTMQWVALPPCPVDKHQRKLIATYLICQPPYNHNQDYKFRVVEVRDDLCIDTFNLVVYCSEICEWKEINLRVTKKVGPEEPEIVVCNGIIYFKIWVMFGSIRPV